MEWKRISESNYEVSMNGDVRNVKTGHILKPSTGTTSKYFTVFIRRGGRARGYLIHRLVAECFLPNELNKPQVNHIDGNKLNNSVSNLEWVTQKENMKHALDSGLYKKFNNQVYKGKFGKYHNRSMAIECNGVVYYGISEASRMTGIPISTISIAIKDNRTCHGLYFKKYDNNL